MINCQKRTDGFWQLIESLIKLSIKWQLFRRLIKKLDQLIRSSEIRSTDPLSFLSYIFELLLKYIFSIYFGQIWIQLLSSWMMSCWKPVGRSEIRIQIKNDLHFFIFHIKKVYFRFKNILYASCILKIKKLNSPVRKIMWKIQFCFYFASFLGLDWVSVAKIR